jgi:RNA polymerase sigma-70 factor (ECF subfamily)
MPNESDNLELLRRASRGDRGLLEELLAEHRDKLRRMVHLRMDRRLQRRIDASDVIQEAFVEAAARLEEYIENPTMPMLLWLRLITAQKLRQLHRRHFGVQARDLGREITLDGGAMPQASSAALAAQLVGRFTAPSQAARKAELKMQVHHALNGMDAIDREILALRHFEQLTLAEAGQVLGIQRTAANNRYVRALSKFVK